MKKTAIALAIAVVNGVTSLVKVVGRFVLALISLPLLLLVRLILRPIAFGLYRWTMPLRLTVKRVIAPAKSALFYPLTTRSIGHILIGLITVVVSTNSIAAKEVGSQEQGQRSLLASIVSLDGQGSMTTIRPSVAPTANRHADVLAVADGAASADVVLDQPVDALATPLLTDTTTAGQPRRDIVHYNVEGGDTLSTIAEKYGISTRSLLWANGLTDNQFIKPGQDLTIPPVSGVIHTVKSGQTLAGIAQKYHADVDAILAFNSLASADAIEPNQTLVIPGGELDQPAPTPRRFDVPSSAPQGAAPPSAVAPHGPGLFWPSQLRRINQGYFGFHRGLDIDGNIGQPIYAADDGVVEAVLYERYGYGHHVIVNHGGGLETLYAHANRVFVRPGERVARGQTIAEVGMTGRTTGPHVHFEVHKNGVQVNPLGYLR